MLKIGFCEVSLTPDVNGLALEGQFYERLSEYVETPITVTAMAVDGGEAHSVVCSCDLTFTPACLMERVREIVSEAEKEINPESIILAATHTHSAMKLEDKGPLAGYDVFLNYIKDLKPYQRMAPESKFTTADALEFVSKRVAEAIVSAWRGRKTAYVANEVGYAAVSWGRRAVYSDGTAKMYGNTHVENFEGIECSSDNGVELLYVFDEKKELMGVAANVCCPAQIVELHSFISSDYWGKARMFLRERFGDKVCLLGLCGAGGDQSPRDLIRSHGDFSEPMYNVEGTLILGKRIANIIDECYETAVKDMTSDAPVSHNVEILSLPIRQVSPLDVERCDAKIRETLAKNPKDYFNYEDYQDLYNELGIMERAELQKTVTAIDEEIHSLRIGDTVFVTNPFELFINFGNQIKARSLAKNTFILQLSCGARGYLPTDRAARGGHYSAYIASGFVGEEGGRILVEKSVEMINSEFLK